MNQYQRSTFSVQHAASVLLALAVIALLAIPAVASAQSTTTLSGIIFLNSTEMLSSTAIVTIQLADVTVAGEPAIVITERIFSTSGAQSPFSFSLPYDPAKIDAARRYSVQGNIRVAGQTLYTTSVAYPVITQGNPTANLQISMRKLTTAGMPPASAGSTALVIAGALLLAGLGAAVLRRKLV